MKSYLIIFVVAVLLLPGCSITAKEAASYVYLESHPLVESARQQIGVVTQYDTGYYQGGYPPDGRGACTDVVERALRDNGYDLKEKIDKDIESQPEKYPQESDPNINFRRVRNVKIFLDHYAQQLPTCTDSGCLDTSDWQPGDIVTFDQIPGSLWHIAIISNKMREIRDGKLMPLLIHNYGHGVVEDDMLLKWPAPVTGHYRLTEIQ